MENAIPALVIGAILLVASSLMARGSLHTYDQLSVSVKHLETRLMEQSGTRLTISSPALDGSRDTLTFNLTNDGQTRLSDFTRVDLILTYYTSPTVRQTVWFPYEGGTPTPGTWTIVSITNDTYEPGILNPGETAQVSVELTPAVEAGKTNLIVIATDSGSSITFPFTS